MGPFYTRKVLDHFRKPRNARVLENADGVGRAINEACSDVVQIFIRVEGDSLEEVTFKAQGCVACIAAASMTTVLATGMSLEDGLALDKFKIAEALDGMPENKMDCSMISPTALQEAIADAKGRSS